MTAKRIDFRKLEKLVTENLAREKKIALFSCFTRENGDFWCQKRVSDNGSEFLENVTKSSDRDEVNFWSQLYKQKCSDSMTTDPKS